MNEIEKMYENAEVESVGFNPYKLEDEYPPFTAEKQLELIILLANREVRINPRYIISGYYSGLPTGILATEVRSSKFEEALAQHINNLWQDLTEEEKQQIKEILQ